MNKKYIKNALAVLGSVACISVSSTVIDASIISSCQKPIGKPIRTAPVYGPPTINRDPTNTNTDQPANVDLPPIHVAPVYGAPSVKYGVPRPVKKDSIQHVKSDTTRVDNNLKVSPKKND